MSVKLTHEEFLNRLYQTNKYYRNGDFEILENYKSLNIPIKAKNKYGICSILPSVYFKDANLSITSAINKTEYFINMCIEKFGVEGNDDLSEVEYINCHTKIKVIDKTYGPYFIIPNAYSQGVRGAEAFRQNLIKTKRQNQKEVFDRILKLNPNLYIIPNQKYMDKRTMLYVRDNYGICRMRVCELEKGAKPSITCAIDKKQYYINRAREVHGTMYNYSLVNYINNKTKIKIISKYGIFIQSASSHLMGKGCPLLAAEKRRILNRKQPQGWNYSNWQKAGEISKDFDSFKLYFLKCWDNENNEIFYKVGRTYRKVIKRIRSNQIPYNTEILHIIESNSAREICELEEKIKNKHKKYKYLPKKIFHGRFECFTKLNY